MDTIASLFSFITWPVSWVIVQFHKLYGAIFGPDTGWAWGLSIVSLVVLIRICLIPLFVKQIKSTRNMQVLQPKMKAIQERYKSDKQRQSEEMMKLYKETGTNPLSSCLPILAQSPFFFALYHVLSAIASNKKIGVIDQSLLDSARQAHIFGAPLAAKFMDSAEKVEALGASLTDVRIVTAVMIVMMSASQFFTQRQLMTKNVDLTVKTPYMQQQKMLMYIFPLIFAVMGINFPVGVLVYWLTTNVWTMGQQMYVINQNPTPGSKAQEQYLGRLLKSVTSHGEVKGRTRRNTVKRIVAKGTDRNDIERKFVTGLAKLGLAPRRTARWPRATPPSPRPRAVSHSGASSPSVRRRRSARPPRATRAAPRTSRPTSPIPSRRPPCRRAHRRTPSPSRRASPRPAPHAKPSPDSARARSGPSTRPRSKKESIRDGRHHLHGR